MSLADLAKVINKKFIIEEFRDDNDEPIEVTVKPITFKKAWDIVENYGIFVEELIFKKIDPDKLDEVDYVINFGKEKFDEAVSYVIGIALDEPDMIETIHLELPWHTKIELLNAIVELSLPKDKKKAQEEMEKIMTLVGEPLLRILSGGKPQEESKSDKEKPQENKNQPLKD